jgi:hypothetical protein
MYIAVGENNDWDVGHKADGYNIGKKRCRVSYFLRYKKPRYNNSLAIYYAKIYLFVFVLLDSYQI